jgi:spermidine synthase
VLAQRLADRHVQTRWVTPDYIKYVFTTDRFGEIRRQLEATAGVRLNEDLRPICYYYDLALWLSRFYPGLRGVFESAGWINLWWVAIPLALVVPLGRWRRGWAMPIAVAGIGLAQMLLEIVIIFAFQLQHGSLYAEVSLLVTAFMGGLAAGGAGGLWILRTPPTVSSQVAARRWLYGVQAAIALSGGILALMLSRLTVLPQPAFPVLTLLAGSLTGVAFPLAAATAPADGGRTAGILYGADLAGGCLGALVGTGLLVPLLGLPQTCATIMLIGVAGLLVM